jgi:hypothetical protein
VCNNDPMDVLEDQKIHIPCPVPLTAAAWKESGVLFVDSGGNFVFRVRERMLTSIDEAVAMACVVNGFSRTIRT